MKAKKMILPWMKSEASNKQPSPVENQWNHSAGSEMLIKEVLNPLLEIIFLYRESSCYNYVPGTEEDCDAGWAYFEKRFYAIYRGLEQNLYISREAYKKARKIIEEIQCFTRQCSGADGLPERYFLINPNLTFYRCPFDLKEEDEEAYELARKNGLLGYVPSEKDFAGRKEYFSKKEQLSDRKNFHYDREDFFMQELAYTLRLVFLKDLSE